MCGLAGVLGFTGGSESMAVLLRQMTAAIAHRGPDADGQWFDSQAGIGLGHRRLSILDLSAAGAQPMQSHCGRFVVAFNGEIYNFSILRRSLEEQRSVVWRGHSDTEVLLQAIAAWGLVEALRRCDGMFALALWDKQERVLHLARDRFGEKPLYYGLSGGAVVFGSELKALIAFPGFERHIDRDALESYLRLGYIPAPASIYRNVQKLLPGSVIRFGDDPQDWSSARPVCYWSALMAASGARTTPFTGDLQSAVSALDALLREEVGLRMVSDVPLGAMLSGGIDSSVIVALMQAGRSDRVKTFSIGSQSSGHDEAVHAREVAAHLGTEHTELYVDGRMALDVIPLLPAMYDEPFADSSQIPTYLVSQLARNHVTVALSGDAGDELFGGYNRYFHGRRIWAQLRRWPVSIRAPIAAMLRAVPPSTWDSLAGAVPRAMLPAEFRAGRTGEKLHKLAGVMGSPDARQFLDSLRSHWNVEESLVIGATSGAASVLPEAFAPDEWDFAERAMMDDTLSYLPDDILCKVDRASMAVSLEARVPFLARRVYEFAWSLPLDQKIAKGYGKEVLRQLLYRYVPRHLVDRPKQGFGIPIAQWLRSDLRDWAEDLLGAQRLRTEGFFETEKIRRCWSEHLSGKRNWDTRLWSVLMFQAWKMHVGK